MPNSNIYMALDLEMCQPSEKIIEIGYCFLDLSTERIFGAESLYVNPGEVLTEYITKLTGITQEMVDSGTTLNEAFLKMQTAAKQNNAQTQGRVITWGQGDVRLIKQQLGNTEEINRFFGRRYLDVKTIFQVWRLATSQPMQGGLAKSILKLGLKFEGRKHSGADDAVNVARAFLALLKKFRA